MAHKKFYSLQEMVWLIDRYKLRNIEVLGHDDNADSKYAIFYDKIADGTLQDDNDAAKLFFGTDEKDGNYQRFKGKFQRRLTNSIFLIDVKKPEFNNAQEAYYNCWKQLCAIKYLIGRGALHAAHNLSKKILPYAMKYDLTVVVIETAVMLRSYYATVTGNRKEWEKCSIIVEEYVELRNVELRAIEMREEISIDYITSKSPKKYKSEQARKFLEELKPSLEKYPNSYWLPLCANLISIHERMVVFDYINTAEVCRKAIQFFEAKPYETKLPIALFSHQLLVCLVMMKAYEEAEIVAQKAEKLVPNGSLNWFRGREQFLVLQFHCRRYEEAYETFQSVTRHQKFKSMAESEQEVWRIYGAYFEYFIMTGRISPNKKSTRRKFKLTKFLNEIPTFSKDKKGLNIPILLIQILFQLEAHHYDKVEDRLLALEKYATRHLNEEDASFRTACLVKMLRFMPQNGYNLKKLIPKTKNLLIRMSKVPVMIADQLHEIEAIPYEDYWKYATVSLEKK